MALRDLVEADCGGSNSLVRLTSHFTSDHALKDEGLRHPFTHGENFGDSDQLVQQFLESTLGHSPQTFRMDSLLREMREMEAAVLAPVASPGIAELAADPQCDPREWVDQYMGDGKNFMTAPSTEDIWSDSRRDANKQVSQFGLNPIWAQEYIEASEDNQEELLPLAELSALSTEWTESEDKAILDKSVDATEILSTVSEPRTSHSKFMKFMRPSEETESTEVEKEAENWTKEFEETLPWEEQFQNRVSAIERPGTSGAASLETEKITPPPIIEDVENPFTNQFWDKLQDSWSKLDQEQSWLTDFNEYVDPFKEYQFEKDNPMADNKDALEEGKKRLAEGDIPSAVLCFEAAVQAEPENALAWQLLGCTQAENEQDPMAIPALKKCLAIEPDNLTALMAIAVSFSNESYQNQACHALKEWLRVNPKYSDLVPPQTSNFKNMMGALSSLMPRYFWKSGVHEEVKNMYIEAARRSPSDSIDADVQCGLGVLFHLSDEFDKAVDCFKAALQVRPGDFRLWNRLGATLANGSRSEEAVDAYHHALQLFPGFIRARYNLGITCVNLGAHKEAAEHFLTALNQQAAGRGAHGERASAMSDTIWSTLKLVITLMESHHLFDAIDERDLEKLNKEFNID